MDTGTQIKCYIIVLCNIFILISFCLLFAFIFSFAIKSDNDLTRWLNLTNDNNP